VQRQRRALAALGACALAAVFAQPCLGLDIVRKGKPVASIVLPAQPLAIESYAAEELQYHVKAASGAQLQIVSEDSATGSGLHIYLGHCRAAAEAGADPSGLPGNGYVIRTAGRNLYVAGHDSPGEATNMNTHAGTLFAVYDLLEEHLGVRWLWPGKLGEVIPSRKDVTLPVLNKSVKPVLWFKEWRGGLAGGRYGRYDPSQEFSRQQAKWLRRQRFGRSVQPSYGHSFGDYWGRFSKTHPEYFAMMPDGTRGPNPVRTAQGPVDPRFIHMCVSEPGLWKQIIEDWKAKGMPEFLNICENDGYAECCCPRCLSWDVVDTGLRGRDYASELELVPVPADKRVDAAKRMLDAGVLHWPLQLGSLSDRYARYAKIVSEQARAIRPDVKVVSYAYDNYRKPPFKTVTLSENVVLGFVPWFAFPYNREVSETFQTEWAGWAATGASLFLRPNYTLEGHCLPVSYARELGQDLKFAMAHSMKGADFDSLTGQYSTQGPTMYMLVKILNHPLASIDAVIDEFCSAFGPAQQAIKKYFQHWEAVTQALSMEKVQSIKKAKRKYGELDTAGLLEGPEIFTPDAMRKGWTFLETARKQAAGDALASARVEWLAKGLKHTELVLAAQKAYERGVDTGDRSEFEKAHKELTEFRKQHATDGIANFGRLSGPENRIWGVRR
jgi:hypothetical protein